MKPPKVPHDFNIPDIPLFTDRFTKAYKLIKNFYGLKDVGRTWNQHLISGLVKHDWKQLTIDTCMFTKQGLLLLLYVDDACIISPSQAKIHLEIKSLLRDYDLTDEGKLEDYLGTLFQRNKNGTVTLSMPWMIERDLDIVGFNTKTHIKTYDTPTVKNLTSAPDNQPRVQKWYYRSTVGYLSYIYAMIRLEICYVVQHCVHLNDNPSKYHEEAVKIICCYLLLTKIKILVLKPDKSSGLECYTDADWVGAWKAHSSTDPLSIHSRTSCVILYARYPILWKSKL